MDLVQLGRQSDYRGGTGVMKDIGRHADVRRYLDRLCAQIKSTSVHEEIRMEMQSHLEELIAENIERGKSEDEAVQEAILRMGDPHEVGRQLHRAHKPRTEWGVIALAACMLLLGLVTSLSLQATLDWQIAIGRKLVFVAIGAAVMGGLYFVDYRRLLRLSGVLYAGTLLLMAAAQWRGFGLGLEINGVRQYLTIGTFAFNVCAAAPYLLIAAVAGMLHNERTRQAAGRKDAAVRLVRGGALYAALPVYLFASAPALGYMITYLLGLAVLLLLHGRWKLLLTGLGFIALAALYARQSFNPDLFAMAWQRHVAFLHRDADTAYHTVQSLKAIHAGGLWGHGFGASLKTLPYISGEMAFSYLVYSLGWVFGAAVCTLVLLFVSSMIRMGMKLPDGYGRSLIIGLSLVFGIQYAWNVLMCFGMFPILGGMQMPILNWSANVVVELGSLGLMLGAYRRKDMLGGAHSSALAEPGVRL